MATNIRPELPRHPITGELLPHRDAMGVPTFKVRVLTAADFRKLTKGKN
jgi:hypothetical protein